MASDIPKRLRVIADLIERGALTRDLLIGLVKITRELIGEKTDDTHLRIESQFGAISHKGVVRIEINNEWAILSPSLAREQALYLLECASAAEFDEFVYTKLGPELELDDRTTTAMLMMFREWREMNKE